MAVFTTVSSSDLTHWLRHYDLGDVTGFRGISSGIENSNFFLSTTRGEYVLTIFERLTATQLPFYLELMRHLATRHVPVPNPVARNDGMLLGMLHGKPAAIVTKLAGAPELAPQTAHCIEVGQMLAHLHLAGRDYAQHQLNLRSLAWWEKTVPAIASYVTEEQCTLLLSELAYQQAFFTSTDYQALPEGPCHCDLFRDNVLFMHSEADQSTARLGGFFDFYFAGCDKWLFDIAVTVNDWCVDLTTGTLNRARTDALLCAYQTVRPLTPIEKHAWADMLRAAAYRFWVSRLYDSHLPRAAEMLKPHDPSHFERILRERIASGIAHPDPHSPCN